MLRSNWVKLAAIGGIIFLSSLTLIGWGLAETSKYQRQADYRANHYAEYTREKVGKSCVGPLTVNQADCVEQARKEARENQRDEQDLVAQRQSALWAYVMAVAAVIGMALSAVGVFLVYTTFNETRKANEIAENTAERHLRPYVFVTEAMLVGTENDGAAINISFKNFGATPAYGVTIQSGVAIVRLPVESSPILDTDVSCARVIAPSQQIETSAIVEGVKAFRAALQQNGCIILHTKITYEISPGITDSDEETVIADLDDIANGRFRLPREGEILNP